MAELTGREAECEVLDPVVEAIRAGQSWALVVLGEAGVGKTALLDYPAGRAQGCLVLRPPVSSQRWSSPWLGSSSSAHR